MVADAQASPLKDGSRLIRLLAWEKPDKSGVMEVVLAPRAAPGKQLLDQVRDVMRLKGCHPLVAISAAQARRGQ
jgi:hypothetical protein